MYAVPVAHSQDVVAGDGTTSVVVICGSLLKKAQELLERGVHPTVISDSFNKAAQKACEVGMLVGCAYASGPACDDGPSSWDTLDMHRLST